LKDLTNAARFIFKKSIVLRETITVRKKSSISASHLVTKFFSKRLLLVAACLNLGAQMASAEPSFELCKRSEKFRPHGGNCQQIKTGIVWWSPGGGEANWMSQHEAIEYCSAMGMQLPIKEDIFSLYDDNADQAFTVDLDDVFWVEPDEFAKQGIYNSVSFSNREEVYLRLTKKGAVFCMTGKHQPRDRSLLSEATFVTIPAGSFMMGSPDSEAGRYNEGPQHQVTISRDFEMQTTEVTQVQWFSVMGNNPSYFKEKKYCPGEYKEVSGVSLCPNNPVDYVRWDDAQEFIDSLNSQENSALDCGHNESDIAKKLEKQRSTPGCYRLPTEAEWEYAARAGTSGLYGVSGNLRDFAWYDGNSGAMSHPVGKLLANKWSLFDMHGNVWEWTADWYDSYPPSAVTDPIGPLAGSNRVIRGGSWVSSARICRSAVRFYFSPDNRSNNLGFRLLRTRP